MVKKFVVGKKYYYSGKERRGGWNYNGKMDIVLDGKPRKCIAVAEPGYALFEGMKNGYNINGTWCWFGDLHYWHEYKPLKKPVKKPKKTKGK